MVRVPHTADTKAQVLAALAMGVPAAKVARDLGVPRGTVQGWAREAQPVASLIDTQKERADLGELVYEYIESGLRAAIVFHQAFADPKWAKEQGATTHRIYGTLVDKLVMVARGIERAPADPVPGAEGSGEGGGEPPLSA